MWSELEWPGLAKKLIPLMHSGDWIWLDGPLGVGKTSFARAFVKALGYEGRVRSPSFALLNDYRCHGVQVIHIDGFRLKPTDRQEWDVDDWGDAFVLAEWPENTSLKLERFSWKIQIRQVPEVDAREVKIFHRGVEIDLNQ